MGNYVDNQSDDMLIGWKAISRYLGVCCTTARRWEAHGLPVARLPDGRVAMTKGLIAQWLLARLGASGDAQKRMAHARQFSPNNQAKTAQDQAA